MKPEGIMATSFLVFSDDWGEHPSSCQHIFRHIVRHYPVIWVNTVGMRLPRFTRQDALKAFRKLKRMFFTTSKGKAPLPLPENLSVLQPFMVPYNKGLWRALNRKSVIKAVRGEMKRRGLERPVLVTTVPNACDYIGAFGERRTVYYCVDDFAEWPGHERDLILQMEKDLVSKADVFVATSERLYQRLKEHGKPTFFLPHGVDLRAFADVPEGAEHQALAPISRPRVGYVGLIDARLDWELLEALVKHLPQVNFVFVGRAEVDISRLKAYANFHHLPPVPYTEVPLVLKSFEVLILPYQVNEFTQTINPLKLKEYLASGAAVLGVPLEEIIRYEPHVRIARSPEEWLPGLKALLDEGQGPLEERLKLLAKEDWASKAQEFLDICLQG